MILSYSISKMISYDDKIIGQNFQIFQRYTNINIHDILMIIHVDKNMRPYPLL